MDEKLTTRLAAVEAEYEDTVTQLSDPGVTGDQNRYREISARHAEVKPIVDAYRRYRIAEDEAAEALVRRVRAFAPTPGSFTLHAGEPLRILAARAVAGDHTPPPAEISDAS